MKSFNVFNCELTSMPYASIYKNYRTKKPNAPKCTNKWLVGGFLLLLSHSAHVFNAADSLFGRGALFAVRIGRSSVNKVGRVSTINPQIMWSRWRNFCHLIKILAQYSCSFLPFADSSLRLPAHALGWGLWQGSLTSWKALSNLLVLEGFHSELARQPVCLLSLNSPERNFFIARNFYTIPSIGLNVLPKESDTWAGVVSTHRHPLLQYFILACVWSCATSKK